MPRGVVALSALAAGLILSACGEEPLGANDASDASVDAGAPLHGVDGGGDDLDNHDAFAGAADIPSEIIPPNTPAGRSLDWLLDELNGDGIDLREIRAAFAPSVFTQTSQAALLAMVRERRRVIVPGVLVALEDPSDYSVIGVVVGRYGLWHRVAISIDPISERIDGLKFFGAPELDPNRLDGWTAFEAGLAELASDSSFLVAEINNGACQPIAGREPTRPLAIGSTFKLYVLAALAAEIEAGLLDWGDRLEIQQTHKSLPTGQLHLEQPGTTIPLEKLAEKMISISDNTATDHLITALGRDRIEKTLAAMGHSNPELNEPFLQTRELFILKLLTSPTDRARFLAGSPSERLHFLEDEIDDVDVFDALENDVSWPAPMFIEELQWFGSAADTCEIMRQLRAQSRSTRGAPIAGILSKNPGLDLDPEMWPFVAFKGGSEPGVLNMTWLLQRRDGRWFHFSMTLNDPEQLVPTDYGVYHGTIAATLLAQVE